MLSFLPFLFHFLLLFTYSYIYCNLPRTHTQSSQLQFANIRNKSFIHSFLLDYSSRERDSTTNPVVPLETVMQELWHFICKQSKQATKKKRNKYKILHRSLEANLTWIKKRNKKKRSSQCDGILTIFFPYSRTAN